MGLRSDWSEHGAAPTRVQVQGRECHPRRCEAASAGAAGQEAEAPTHCDCEIGPSRA